MQTPTAAYIAQVREDLPAVLVRYGKQKPVDGRVSGRLNDDASVSGLGPCGNGTLYPIVHVSWTTVAYCILNGLPITA